MNTTHLYLEEKFIIESNIKIKKEDFPLSSLISANGFIEAILDFLKINDSLEDKTEVTIFTRLYIDDEHLEKTSHKIMSEKLFIAERTLYRLRIKFIKLIKIMLEKYRISVISAKYWRERA